MSARNHSRVLRVLAAFGLAALLSLSASAHTKSESYAIYEVDGATVHLTYSVTEIEAVRLAPAVDADRAGEGGAAGRAAPSAPRHLTDE